MHFVCTGNRENDFLTQSTIIARLFRRQPTVRPVPDHCQRSARWQDIDISGTYSELI